MKIHHIALRTRDVASLITFYRDVLGLGSIREGAESCWLDAGGAILMIERSSASEPPVVPETRELLAFAVTPGDRARFEARLASRGVTVEARTEFTLYFRDPDGRRLGLSHYPERAA